MPNISDVYFHMNETRPSGNIFIYGDNIYTLVPEDYGYRTVPAMIEGETDYGHVTIKGPLNIMVLLTEPEVFFEGYISLKKGESITVAKTYRNQDETSITDLLTSDGIVEGYVTLNDKSQKYFIIEGDPTAYTANSMWATNNIEIVEQANAFMQIKDANAPCLYLVADK